MDLSAKKVLYNLFYYTMALFVLLFSVFFMVSLASRALAPYQQWVYYIWTGLLIITLLADVIATVMNRHKFLIGLIVYGLMVIAVIVGIIVFSSLNVGGMIPVAVLDSFNVLIFYSLALTIGLIVTYRLGVKLNVIDELEAR